MRSKAQDESGVPVPRKRRVVRRAVASFGMVLLLGLSSMPAQADEYDSPSAGHPLRIVGYVVHPVGVVFDFLVLRPFYWVGSHEPFKTFFGRAD